jgi:hypothetical protein
MSKCDAPQRKSKERGVYRCVSLRIWGDAGFRQLSRPQPNGQSCFFYLLTAKEGCIIPGVIPAGAGAMAETLRWTPEAFREAFGELLAQGMAKVDWEAPLVWIPNAPRHNPPASPNVVRAWGKAWSDIPECALKDEMFRALESFCLELGPPFAKAFAEAFPEPLPHPSPNQEQEQEQEIQIPSVSAAQAIAPPTPPKGQGPLFEPPPGKPRPKPTNAQAAFVAWMAEARGKAVLSAPPDMKPNWGQHGPELAKALGDHGRKLLESAYLLFLADSYARERNPPCPLGLFVAQWPKWVSEAQRAQGAADKRPSLLDGKWEPSRAEVANAG